MFEFGVNFEIHVGIEPAKLVMTFGIGNLSLDVVGFLVSQIDDSAGDGILIFVHHVSVNRTQLRTVAAVLRANGNSGKNKHHKDKRYRRRNPSRSQLDSPSYDSSGNRGIAP